MMKRKLCAFMTAAILIAMLMPVTAAANLTPISGTVLNDQLSFKLDGKTVVPVGDDGTPVLPISYNGTTYLPVRAVGYLLALGIDWEASTQTVVISSATSKAAPAPGIVSKTNSLIPISGAVLNSALKFRLDGKAVIPVGDDGTPVLPVSYNGTTYLPVRAMGYLLGLGIGWDGAANTVLITSGGAGGQTGAGWHLKEYKFVDGSGRTDSVLMGTSAGLYDVRKYTGDKGNVRISNTRYDTSSGKVLAGVTYSVKWTDPPSYMAVGSKPSFELGLSTESTHGGWRAPQISVNLNQGLGANFASSDGTKYMTQDMHDTFTLEKEAAKGAAGQDRRIQIVLGAGFEAVYLYEWKE